MALAAPTLGATRPSDAAVQRLVQIATEALPPELAHLAAGPLAESLAKAVDFARNSISERTQKIYLDNWTAFQIWCDAKGAPSLPTVPALIAAYLSDRSATLGRSGLRLSLAAISHYHRRAGLLSPTSGPVISSVMQGILRSQQRQVRPAAALTSVELRQLLHTCVNADPTKPPGIADLRDRALLLTCLAGALRRSELVALDREDVTISDDGLILKIKRSKSDQEGQGAEVLISAGSGITCPVRAMRAWLRASAITYGPIFRRITAAGTIEGRLTGNGVWRILRARAEKAELTVDDSERLSPHGFRAGYIVEAYLNGALDEQAMGHARQKSLMTTRRYRNRAKTVGASPTKLLDL